MTPNQIEIMKGFAILWQQYLTAMPQYPQFTEPPAPGSYAGRKPTFNGFMGWLGAVWLPMQTLPPPPEPSDPPEPPEEA